MLRGTEKWVTYFVLLIVFVFGIVLLAKQIGVTTDLKHSLLQARQSNIYTGDLKKIVSLHTASSKVFFLTFFALCLLAVGVIVIVRGTEKAYDIAEVKEKVRHHLKSITPGIVLVVLSAFLLAFCAFRSSHIETVYSSRLLDYNNLKIASLTNNWMRKPDMPFVDTSSLDKLKSKKNKKEIADVPDVSKKVAQKSEKRSGAASTLKTKKQDSPKGKVVHTEKNAATKNNNHALVKSKAKSARKQVEDTKQERVEKTAITDSKVSQQPVQQVKEQPKQAPVAITNSDLLWAEKFQRNVTIYGYVANPAEQTRFSRILHYVQNHGDSSLNKDLTWAYLFLEKTKKGYQPKPGEMQRYENIIERNLKSSASIPQNYNEL